MKVRLTPFTKTSCSVPICSSVALWRLTSGATDVARLDACLCSRHADEIYHWNKKQVERARIQLERDRLLANSTHQVLWNGKLITNLYMSEDAAVGYAQGFMQALFETLDPDASGYPNIELIDIKDEASIAYMDVELMP